MCTQQKIQLAQESGSITVVLCKGEEITTKEEGAPRDDKGVRSFESEWATVAGQER